MNERIQELAVEAEDYADSIVDQGGEFHPAYTQKLAELMMEEMYDFIMEEVGNDNGIPDLGKIKEHFGVEE